MKNIAIILGGISLIAIYLSQNYITALFKSQSIAIEISVNERLTIIYYYWIKHIENVYFDMY